MSIKVLAIGDPHFKGEERRSRGNKIATDKLREEVMERIKRHKPSIVVVLGDTLDRFSHVHTVALKDATDWFYDMAKLVEHLFVLIGNHDRPTADDFMSDCQPFTGIRGKKKIHIVSASTSHYCEELGKYLLFVPWVPPGRFAEAVDAAVDASGRSLNLDEVAAIFAHQEFRGCRYRSIISRKGDVWPSSSPFVISGHIHDYKRLSSNILYVGSPMQHEFGDESTEDGRPADMDMEASGARESRKSISLLTFNSGESMPIEKRLYLNIIERKQITISVKKMRERYQDFLADALKGTILWKITIRGFPVDVDGFLDSKKGKRLHNEGILLFPWYLSKAVKTGKASNPAKLSTDSFQSCLVKRAGKDKLQLLWLERLVREGA